MDTERDSLLGALERERTVAEVCSRLNNFVDLRPTLITVIEHIRSLTKCEAVAIRLHDGGDYPYYVYRGFPESFVLQENSLCAKDNDGVRIPDPCGVGFALECMCGNVLRGRTDPSFPFFTENGSFWSNNTSELLASTTEDDRQARTRNYCNSCGYETVVLVPIKARGETIGLIQINDMRIGMVDEDLLRTIEMIGQQVGLAVQNSMAHTKLKEALKEIETLRGIIPICGVLQEGAQ